MSITADGGWFTAVLLIALLFVGMMAYRKRWPAARRPVLAVVDGTTVVEDAPKPAKKEKHSHGHGGGHTILSLSAIILMWVGIAALAVYVLFHIPEIIDTASRLAGIRVVHSQQSYVVPRTNIGTAAGTIREAARAERERIEGERHVLTLTYGDRLQWIRVPFGGYITHFTVDDKKAVGTQCSSNPPSIEPPIDASGEAYECHDGIMTNWVRFSAWDAGEGPVTVHYQFKYAY